MLADLLHTTTSDGQRLDGALLTPAAQGDSSLAIDAAVCLPGVAANFYGSTMLEDLARPLLAAGSAVLWANTRGHDLVYTASSPNGTRRQGASYEIVDDCRYDLAAWCALLGERGYGRIGLIGHSLGAIKATYAAAKVAGLSVQRVVAVSPPRLCYTLFKQAGITSFEQAIAQAEQLAASGEPQTLIEARFPFPLMITAASYLDKYGPAERYDLAHFAAALPCPALFVYGGEELASGGVAFAGLDQLIGSLADDASQRLEVQVIDRANHFYSGKREELGQAVVEWLRSQ
jgi:pimeloyl-ACP methyl ester carboxylesterase